MKKKADFIQQMQNSQQFLTKLKGFQKVSKDMKQKNKLVSHRNIWVKQSKYLSRLQRDADFQINQYFTDFDKYFEYQIQDKQIFARDQYKSYTQMLRATDQQLQHYQNNVWQQLRSLPLLLTKTKQMTQNKTKQINIGDVGGIVQDIGSLLHQIQQKNIHQLSNLQRQSILFNKSQQQSNQNQQYRFLHTILGKGNTSQIKGFDFQMPEKRRIQQGQAYLTEYLEEFQNHLSSDEISEVIQQYQHTSYLLHQTFELEIQKINLDYQQALNLDDNVVGTSDNYQRISHIYNTYIGRGKLVTLYYQRLSLQFPKINRKILQRITQYVQAKIYKQKKINAIHRNYWRQKQQLLSKVEKQVNDRVESKIKKAQKQAEYLHRKQQKLKLQIQLEKLRKDYYIKKQQEDRKKKQQEDLKVKQQKKKQAIRRLYLDQLNKKAAEVHQIKQKKVQEEQKKAISMKQIQQKQKIKLLQKNKPKIQMRQSHQKRKLQKKIQQVKIKEKQQVIKQQRINKAIQKYSFRPEVQPSEQRLNAPTQALISKKATKYDKADKIELTKMTGYNINQLMGDMRYKLNTALSQAGLANTDYAREVLNTMSKRNNQ